MHQGESDRSESTGARRLAVPIAIGLGLFLGGNRVVDLAGAPDGDRYFEAAVASVVIRYVGAVMVALGSFTLVRRHLAAPTASGEGRGDGPAASRPPRRVALIFMLVGLALMATFEGRWLVLLFQVNSGDYSGDLIDGALGTVVQGVLLASAYLGPAVTAVGAYLMLRRFERAAVDESSGTSLDSAEVVTDLDA